MKKIALITASIAFLSALCSPVFSTELMPWTQTDLLLYPRFDYLYQHYNKVNSSSGSEHRNAHDHFYTIGVLGSYSPWIAEIEATAADTRQHNFGLDNFRVTGRYQWMSDIIGDCASVTVGATYIKASRIALRDISSFHHGRNEVELHISLGKEQTCYNTWASRWWTVGIFGLADHGSPWWRVIAAWEKNFNETLALRLFAIGLLGMGDNSLDLEDSFGGYGSIRHRSIDIGIRLTKITECRGNWSLEYAQRVYAYNFPQSANLLKICLIYPYYPF